MGRRRGRHTLPASPPLPNPPLAQAPHPRGAQCASRPAKTNPSAGVPPGTAARCRRPSPPPPPARAPPSPPPARPPPPPPPPTAHPSASPLWAPCASRRGRASDLSRGDSQTAHAPCSAASSSRRSQPQSSCPGRRRRKTHLAERSEELFQKKNCYAKPVSRVQLRVCSKKHCDRSDSFFS